jgi:hypothetical protein
MIKERNFLKYKRAVIFILAMAVGLQVLMVSFSKKKHSNYLFIGQMNFDHHLLANDLTTKKKIFFLGSSAVAGNNIPDETTLADYFNQLMPQYKAYNLATMQANLLDANVILNYFKTKNPKVAVLGIDPSVFWNDQSSLLSKVHSDYIEPENIHLLNLDSKLLFDEKLKMKFHRDPTPPTNFQIWWKSNLFLAREKFWGPLFNKKIFGKEQLILEKINSESNLAWGLIDNFIKLARANGITPVIFLGPILSSTYPNESFEIFKNRMSAKSLQLNFTYLNYSDLLSPTHDNFLDFVHLTPKGNNLLAQKIKIDLISKNIISEKVQ